MEFTEMHDRGSLFRHVLDRTVPYHQASLRCPMLQESLNWSQAKERFSSLPSHPINKRFYTGESLSIQDRFSVFCDLNFLYLHLEYKLSEQKEKARDRRHIILFENKVQKSNYMALFVPYEPYPNMHIGFSKITHREGGLAPSVSFIEPTHMETKSYGPKDQPVGYQAKLSIALDTLRAPVKNLGMNVMRTEWDLRPMTSFVPIAHSYYNEYPNGLIQVDMVVNEQNRTADLVPVVHERDFLEKNVSIQLRAESADTWILSMDTPSLHMRPLYWETPDQKITDLVYQPTDKEAKTRISLPHCSAEGLYRMHFNDTPKTVIAFEKIDLIEAAEPYYFENVSEKCKIQCNCLSEKAKLLCRIVPPYAGLENVPDPKDPSLRPWNLFHYDPNRAIDRAISNKTFDEYPNDDYPEQHVTRFSNHDGKPILYPYYKDEQGTVYYLTPLVWALRKRYVCEHMATLAKEDPFGAVCVLEALTDAYPNYAPAMDYYYKNAPMAKNAGPPYPYFGGLWSRWFYGNLRQVAGIAEAFALIDRTNAFDAHYQKTGKNVREKTIAMIVDTVHYIESYGIFESNMDAVLWQGLVRIGIALERPAYLREVVRRIEEFVRHNFMFDGFWKETTLSYHENIIKGIKDTLNLIESCSLFKKMSKRDPQFKKQHRRLRGIHRIIDKADEVSERAQYPNGKFITIQDTHPSTINSNNSLRNEDMLLSCASVAKLASLHVQAVLYAKAKYGHSHDDACNMTLFCYGVEMLPDIGYTHTNHRAWTISTLAHNTVTVDQSDSKNRKGGDLLQFVPVNKSGIGWLRAADTLTYEQVDIYERQLVMVPGEGETKEGYVLDLFRVQGGQKHEYTLNLCADYDTKTVVSEPFFETKDTYLSNDIHYEKPHTESERGTCSSYHAYMYVEQVKTALLKDHPYRVTTTVSDEPHLGKGLSIVGILPNGELSVARVPSLRATRKAMVFDANDYKDSYQMDKLIVKSEPKHGNTQFVHAIEPFQKGVRPRVHSIERMDLSENHVHDIAVKIGFDVYTDYIFCAFDTMKCHIDGITFEGSCGFVRMHHKKVGRMMAIRGKIAIGQCVTAPDMSVEGFIVRTTHKSKGDKVNGFLVKETVSKRLRCTTVRVTHGHGRTYSYQVHRILHQPRATLIDIGEIEPGFMITKDGSAMTHFPFTVETGHVRYRLEDMNTMNPEGI